jgi:hypothetical protein
MTPTFEKEVHHNLFHPQAIGTIFRRLNNLPRLEHSAPVVPLLWMPAMCFQCDTQHSLENYQFEKSTSRELSRERYFPIHQLNFSKPSHFQNIAIIGYRFQEATPALKASFPPSLFAASPSLPQ